ncbi:MAG TPA: Uma2 family endonuclease [Thermoanaerobaculia bacterium]|jgi:Uma2 family endonuclease
MEAIQTVSRYEEERGKPMPSRNHALAQLHLSLAFARYMDRFSILPELSLELDGQPFVPDLSVYPKIRLGTDAELGWSHDEVRKTEPPLLVVEILSPTQSVDELIRKAEAYLDAGVKSCWIVQPSLKTISVVEAGKPPLTFTGGELTDPATAITVRVEDVFPPFE